MTIHSNSNYWPAWYCWVVLIIILPDNNGVPIFMFKKLRRGVACLNVFHQYIATPNQSMPTAITLLHAVEYECRSMVISPSLCSHLTVRISRYSDYYIGIHICVPFLVLLFECWPNYHFQNYAWNLAQYRNALPVLNDINVPSIMGVKYDSASLLTICNIQWMCSMYHVYV